MGIYHHISSFPSKTITSKQNFKNIRFTSWHTTITNKFPFGTLFEHSIKMELALTMLNQVNHSKDQGQVTQAALIHHHLHHQEHFHGEVLTVPLAFQVGSVITHLVAQASMAEVGVVDHAAMVDEEDMSILKVRRDTGMKDLEVVEALEDEEEEDTQVDGETTVAEDLLPLVVQVEWVGST